MNSSKQKKWLVLVTILIGLFHIVPLYLLAVTSLKNDSDLSSKWILPDYLYLDNFTNAWKNANLGTAFVNNIIITVVSVLVVLVIGAMASYPLARFQTKLNKIMYVVFISALIVPPLSILVPLYQFIVDLGGLNSYWAIICLNVTFNLPMTIFLFTGFISTIPRELDEAAMIDGASRVGLFFKIILPLLKPVTVTVVILTGVAVWNDYQFSVFFLQSSEKATLTVALSTFFSQYNNSLGWVAAGSLVAMLPITVLYLFLQRYFIQGMAAGAVKD
jgi:raffinose/stachyose/melibiose transport system permease protein